MLLTKPLVIVLLGPTASGKTALGIEIAEKLNLNIHNIDSRQIYIGMDIGTAKPTPKEQKRVRHMLIDLSQPNKPLNFQEFHMKAKRSLEGNLKKYGKGLLVGGSGLYLQALIKGLEPPPVPCQNHFRNQLNSMDIETCHELLKRADPISAKRIAAQDSIRTIRALEVFYATGKPISELQSSKPPEWKFLELGLDPPNLRERIANRTCQMYSNGLIEETERLINRFGKDLQMLRTIGFAEALSVIQGTMSINEAIAITTQRTQQFAKRQRTWFKKQHHPYWLNDKNPFAEAMSYIESVIG